VPGGSTAWRAGREWPRCSPNGGLLGARQARRPGGKLLSRPSLRAAGVRNDIDDEAIRTVFAHWHIEQMTRATVPSDTRSLEVLVARLTTWQTRCQCLHRTAASAL
jgi:hypothetical protein